KPTTNAETVVPARKVTKASGTTFAKGPEKIMAANATVPRTVMTLDNAAKDRSARTSCAVNCLIRIASTMANIAASRQPRNRAQFNTYVDCVDENRRRKKVSCCRHMAARPPTEAAVNLFWLGPLDYPPENI